MSRNNQRNVSERYCVVGAGPSGLIAARALLRRGIEVDIVDRNPTIGGVWEISHADSPVYESCNFISDKKHSGFIGFPLPDTYPDYPRWDQIRDYVRMFADAYDLTGRVECGLEVTSAAPISPSGRDGWRVRFATGEEREYRGVIWACGQQHTAYMPTLPGAETFTGEIIHSSEYKSHGTFSGRRVVVVGGGNSGVDIACDAASVGASAALSLRRGYWILPKRVFGLPFQSVLDGTIQVPAELGVQVPEDLAERRAWIVRTFGDYERMGLPIPDEPFGASHSTVNDQIAHYLAHGWLSIRPDIERLDGNDVVFVDGTREAVDIIVMATGFTLSIPWLTPELVDWVEDQPYFHVGSMSRVVHGLYACGLVHFGANTYVTWDQLFQVAVADIVAELTGEGAERAAKIREEYRPNLKGDLPLRKVHRNINHYDIQALRKTFAELRDEFDIEVPEQGDLDFYPMHPALADVH
ncbi:flavin-containing monooxygenase [Arthrobacter sp. P2b]|uniref:flavin-containing monooxygenase n=1 Tax=Arthrobacter sp. P2b TaxID=1938741 RepID=UPI0009A61396|nr:NAD(P)-binding domain-containing protein [Arthrobacter sp. P2b]SLK10600.1 Predicted flavoprotein CzcO associated with the cation diffusion facilitator CzcD [Arthrobacter sp. P2b]